MRGRESIEGDVVVLEDVLGVDVAVVPEPEVVQLVLLRDGIAATAENGGHLGGALVLMLCQLLVLFPAMPSGVADRSVQDLVNGQHKVPRYITYIAIYIKL